MDSKFSVNKQYWKNHCERKVRPCNAYHGQLQELLKEEKAETARASDIGVDNICTVLLHVQTLTMGTVSGEK